MAVLRFVCSVPLLEVTTLTRPRQFGKERGSPSSTWAGILRLATLWKFEDLAPLALTKLRTLDFPNPIDKIVISVTHDLPWDWAADAYISICARAEPLSLDEAERLPKNLIVAIASIRERVLHGKKRRGVRPDDAVVRTIVSNYFSNGLSPRDEPPQMDELLDVTSPRMSSSALQADFGPNV